MSIILQIKKCIMNKVSITYKLWILTAVFIFSSCSILTEKNNKDDSDEKYVVIVSMDGFRYDYSKRFNTPNLDYIAQNGVFSDSLIPVFPSSTFPNHYSIATGLYPDNHGIVVNNFYCPDLDKTYRIRDRDAVENGDFYFGEPIWVTAENQNITSATYFWVGSEAKINDTQPTYWKRYDSRDPFEGRIDTVIHWLNLPEEDRPRLVMLYFNEPDNSGHRLGPDGKEIGQVVEYMDSLAGDLHSKLKELPIYENINLIITSDHGMNENSADRHINLSEYLERDWIDKRHGAGPILIIKPHQKFSDKVFKALSEIENISVWRNSDIPEKFNFGTNPRTLEMTILADIGYSMGFGDFNERYIGSHGYDNFERDMHTVFYAIGPDFKKGHYHGAFKVIDIYPLITKLLYLNPAEIDGQIENTIEMLNR